LGLVAAIVIITRSKTQVHLGKNGILIGRGIDGKIDWVIEELKSVRLAMLRLNLIFEENSLKDRIKDGDKYVEMGGGNGAASVLVEELKTRRVFRRRGPR
jgi:hypothetical protein